MNSIAVRQVKALFLAEVKLLQRSSAIATTSTLIPIGMTVYFVYSGKRDLGSLGWALPVSILLLLMFGMGVYMTTTLALTARREDLYLKRLRSGEASDAAILIGLLSPVILLGLLQCVLVVAIIGIFGPALPGNPLLMVLVVVLGNTMAVTLGMATTGLVGSTQQADMASVPFFGVLVATGVWAATNGPEGPNAGQLLLPGGAVLDVVRLAYDTEKRFLTALVEALPALGVLAVWTTVGFVAVNRFFRWEPRH